MWSSLDMLTPAAPHQTSSPIVRPQQTHNMDCPTATTDMETLWYFKWHRCWPFLRSLLYAMFMNSICSYYDPSIFHRAAPVSKPPPPLLSIYNNCKIAVLQYSLFFSCSPSPPFYSFNRFSLSGIIQVPNTMVQIRWYKDVGTRTMACGQILKTNLDACQNITNIITS